MYPTAFTYTKTFNPKRNSQDFTNQTSQISTIHTMHLREREQEPKREIFSRTSQTTSICEIKD